jgi:hypothetical protein
VAHRDEGLIWRAAGGGDVEHRAVELADSVGDRLLGAGARLGGAQERHGRDPGADRAASVRERNDEPLEVRLPVAPGHAAHHVEAAHRAEERIGRVEARGGVVVAAGDDDLDVRDAPPGLDEEAVPERLRLGRRVGGVEDVARDQYGVHVLPLDGVEEPRDELLVLVSALDAVERVAEVPVGGVEEAQGHGGRRIRGGRTGGRGPHRVRHADRVP